MSLAEDTTAWQIQSHAVPTVDLSRVASPYHLPAYFACGALVLAGCRGRHYIANVLGPAPAN